MTRKNPILQKYNTIAHIYNQVWIIAIIIGFGLFVMQFATGNIIKQDEKFDIPEFDCYQTPNDKLKNIEAYEPKTNKEKSIIKFTEVIKTELQVNAIPPVNEPKFTQNHEEVVKCMDSQEKAVVVVGDNITKVYPFKILRQHLIINDYLGEKPILVTFCVLCNSPMVYDRSFDGSELKFGTTGLLYRNNDLFYDNSSDSLWSQINGRAVIGDAVGQQLTRLNFKIMPINVAIIQYPQSLILTFDTGYRRNYSDKSFEDYEKNNTTMTAVMNTSEDFEVKTTVYAFEIDGQFYAINSQEAQRADFSAHTKDGKSITTSIENGLIRLFINEVEIEYLQSYWYVWYDHYPETIPLKAVMGT